MQYVNHKFKGINKKADIQTSTQHMHTYIRTLQEISGRYAPSRILSFDVTHVYKALQLIETRGHISRDLLCKELNLGEGSIKTLVKHLMMQNMIETSNAGTKMSD